MSDARLTNARSTPGPWTASAVLEDQSVHKRLRPHYYADVRVGDDRPGNVIARVFMGGDGATTNSPEAVESNARLIAAAPKLLKALQLVVAPFDAAKECNVEIGECVITHDSQMLATLRAAIANATGAA